MGLEMTDIRDPMESKGRGRKPARKSFQESGEETGGLKGVTAMERLRGGCDMGRHRIHCSGLDAQGKEGAVLERPWLKAVVTGLLEGQSYLSTEDNTAVQAGALSRAGASLSPL